MQSPTIAEFRVILQNPESIPMNEKVYIVYGASNKMFFTDPTGQIIISQSMGLELGMAV
jgi:hypothetical protein